MSFLGSNKFLSSNFHFKKSFCQSCALGKSTHLPFKISNEISTTVPFNLVHSDVWKSPIVSVSGYKYYVLFIDDYTRFTWLFFMKRKCEVLDHFKNFLIYIKTQFSAILQQFQSDGGGEYVSDPFVDLCSSLGIHRRLSCPHTPEQNGLTERKHRHIADMARTLLLTSHVPLCHWVDAVSTAVHLINRLPSPILKWSSPFSRLYGKSPSYSDLRVFGCACYPHLGAYMTNKLLPRMIECVFLGYSLQYKGYKCLDRKTGRVYISRHVRFDEQTFPFAQQSGHKQSMHSQWAFVPLFPPASETPPQPTTPTIPQHHTAPPIQSASEIPTATDFLRNPLPYHYQHRQSRFSVPLPNTAPVPSPSTLVTPPHLLPT